MYIPVSYTHLDVYKRQLLRCQEQILIHYWRLVATSDTLRESGTLQWLLIFSDVYKRQAIQSSLKGLRKLLLNEPAIYRDLDNCWCVVAEAIQTILRREAYPHPYEALKALTRTNQAITCLLYTSRCV